MRTCIILALAVAVLSSVPVYAGGAHKGACKGDVGAEAAKMASHGWLGIEKEQNASGAYVVKAVVPGSPAEKAGFQKGDVLVAMNGIRLADDNMEALKAAKKDLAVGKQVAYTVQRGGAERTLQATLAPVPREVLAKWVGEHVLDAHATTAVAQN